MTDRKPNNSPDGSGPHHMSDEDRATIVDALVDEMGELFHGYVRGNVPFEELSFELFDTLQTLYAVTHSQMTIEYYDENDPDGLGGSSHTPGQSPNGKRGGDTGRGMYDDGI